MKKTGIITGGLVLFIVVFWLGLIINFPGQAVSRLIETLVNQSEVVKISASPAALGLTGISLENVKIDWELGEQTIPVVLAREVFVPLTWRLFSGLGLEVRIGKEGRADVFYPWDGKALTVNGSELHLADFKGWSTLNNIQVKGVMNLEGDLSFSPTSNSKGARPTQPGVQNRLGGKSARTRPFSGRTSRFKSAGSGLPTGTITGKLANVEISNLEIIGSKIPTVRLETVELGLRLGNRIDVEKGAFRGDFQGSLSGGVTPVGQDLAKAKLDLKLTVAVRQTWLQKLGTLRPIIDAFVKDGQLEGSVQGTAAMPSWIAGRQR